LNQDQTISNDLVNSQKQLIPLMRRSQRLLISHIYASVFSIYVVMLWVILFIALIQLPLQLLLIALAIIALSIAITPLQYKRTRQRFALLRQAGEVLEQAEIAVSEKQTAIGLTSYIFLLFDVIRPTDVEKVESDQNEVEQIRTHLRSLNLNTLIQMLFQGALIILLIIQFIIPGILSLLEAGGSLVILLTIFLPLCFLVVLTVARWAVFVYWQILMRRWLRLYRGFMVWGEELERMYSSSGEESTGGLNL